MRYRKLDPNGDYIMGGREHILAGREAVGQAVKTRLLLLLGEWWEDPEDGFPLFEEILGTFHTVDQLEDIDLILSQRILSTQGVIQLSRFESTVDLFSRSYAASCTIDTAYGQLTAQIGGNEIVQVQMGGS